MAPPRNNRLYLPLLALLALGPAFGCDERPPLVPAPKARAAADGANGAATTPDAAAGVTGTATTPAATVAATKAPSPPSGPDAHVTGDAVWDTYTSAQKRFQRELAELIAQTNPELKEVAMMDRDAKLAEVDLAAARFRYLLNNTPLRVARDKGLAAFVNFQWTEQDSETLRQADPEALKTEQLVGTLTEQANKHPKYDECRVYYRRQIVPRAEFAEIQARYRAAQIDAERLLGSRAPL